MKFQKPVGKAPPLKIRNTHCSDDFTYYDLNIVIVESGLRWQVVIRINTLHYFLRHNDWCRSVRICIKFSDLQVENKDQLCSSQ